MCGLLASERGCRRSSSLGTNVETSHVSTQKFTVSRHKNWSCKYMEDMYCDSDYKKSDIIHCDQHVLHMSSLCGDQDDSWYVSVYDAEWRNVHSRKLLHVSLVKKRLVL